MSPMNPNESRKLARVAGLCSLVLLVFGIVPVVFGLPISLERAPLLALFIVANLAGGVLLLGASVVWNLEGLRELVTARSSRMASNAAVYSAAVVGILVLVNVLAIRHSHKWDLTEEKQFTLAPQSDKVLAGLTTDVTLRAFWRKAEQEQVKDLLANYERASKKVKVEFIDPVEDPASAKQFEISQERTLHVQSGNDQVRITEPNEEKVTNAIIKVSGGEGFRYCWPSWRLLRLRSRPHNRRVALRRCSHPFQPVPSKYGVASGRGDGDCGLGFVFACQGRGTGL